MTDYNKIAAQDLLRRTPNLLRWHERAHAVRTHEHCGLSLAHIELTIAEAIERAYQDGLRDGGLAERHIALEKIVFAVEGVATLIEGRAREARRERDDFVFKRAAPGERSPGEH